jgi:hypothetical protein
MQMNYRPDLGEKKYTFADVQGVDEAKEEVQEVVEFLKNPEKFQRLGARLPTGRWRQKGVWVWNRKQTGRLWGPSGEWQQRRRREGRRGGGRKHKYRRF